METVAELKGGTKLEYVCLSANCKYCHVMNELAASLRRIEILLS